MAENPYVPIVTGVTTGGQAATQLNILGNNVGNKSFRITSALAEIENEAGFWEYGTVVYCVAEEGFYQYDLTDVWLPVFPQITNIPHMSFDLAPDDLNVAEGVLQWNATDGTLNLGMGGGAISLQIGQEMFVRVVNKTLAIIPDGVPVYVISSQGQRPSVALAKGDAHATSCVLGVTTQEIAINAEGYVTTNGYVRKIDTRGGAENWTEGDTLYLSKTVAGGLTNVEPSAPHHSGVIGIVTNVSQTQGSIYLNLIRHRDLTGLSDVDGTPVNTTGQILVWNETNKYWDASDNITDYASLITANTFAEVQSFEKGLVLPKTSATGIKVDTVTPTFGWRDMLGTIDTRPPTGAGAGAVPDFVQYRGNLYAYRFGTLTPNNHLHEAFVNFHLDHDYVPSTDIYIHVHWSQIVVDTGGGATPGISEWMFDISYAKGHGIAGGVGDPFIAPKTITVTQQASTTQYAHMIAEVVISGATDTATTFARTVFETDGILMVRGYRDPGTPNDTLNQDTFVHFMDCHYQSTGIGTKNRAPNFYGA